MCHNIPRLFHFEPPVTDEEIDAAALQYVRKVSGRTRPSRGEEGAFDVAVRAVADATRALVRDGLVPRGPPRTREAERARALARNRVRFAPRGP
jgi:hypothetical protein